jgi:hypothetical protein
VHQQLKALLEAVAAQQAESSASRQLSKCGRARAPSAHGSNQLPSQHQDHEEGGGAATSVVKSRLGLGRDARNTIEARRRAGSVDNQRNIRLRHPDNRGHVRRYDIDDDCDRSWSPNQRGPRAFGESVRDARFP